MIIIIFFFFSSHLYFSISLFVLVKQCILIIPNSKLNNEYPMKTILSPIPTKFFYPKQLILALKCFPLAIYFVFLYFLLYLLHEKLRVKPRSTLKASTPYSLSLISGGCTESAMASAVTSRR